MSTDLWAIAAAAGIEVRPDPDPVSGWVWQIRGLKGWSEPHDSAGAAFLAAFEWLIKQARAQASHEAQGDDLAVWRQAIDELDQAEHDEQ